MSLSTEAGILKRLLESNAQGWAFSRDSPSSLLSTGAGILKRLLGESKYMDRHSQVVYLRMGP